jgi:integrase/recombinase XerD
MKRKADHGDSSAEDIRDMETVLGALTRRGTVGEKALTRAAARIANTRTRGEYTRDVEQYLEHCRSSGSALAEGLESWKAALKAAGLSVASVNRKLSGVKTVLRRAADHQGPEVRRGIEAAVSTVKGVKQTRGAIRAEKMLTPQEVETLLGALSPRGAGFVRFLYATGCRISEALGVRLTDCHANGGVTIEVTGKGGKARKVRISRKLFAELRETFNGTTYLFETSKGNPYPRTYVTDMIERASKRALGRMVGAHALRHSFATAMIARTGKFQGVSEYLGHADPSTTLRFYTHEALTDEELFDGV